MWHMRSYVQEKIYLINEDTTRHNVRRELGGRCEALKGAQKHCGTE